MSHMSRKGHGVSQGRSTEVTVWGGQPRSPCESGTEAVRARAAAANWGELRMSRRRTERGGSGTVCKRWFLFALFSGHPCRVSVMLTDHDEPSDFMTPPPQPWCPL